MEASIYCIIWYMTCTYNDYGYGCGDRGNSGKVNDGDDGGSSGGSSYNGEVGSNHEDTNDICEGMVMVKMKAAGVVVLSVVLVVKMLINMSCYS